jgi:hypothetical protein
MRSSCRALLSALVCLIAVPSLLNQSARAATTYYVYDALGRLRIVSHDNGVQTDYALDPAGNRTNVQDRDTLTPSAPTSLTLTSPSMNGNFLPYWGSSTGTLTRYELYESPSSGFSPQSLVYSGLSLSVMLTGRANGTYYYRVRACNAIHCSGYIPGPNPMVVNIPPPAPGPPTNPTKTFTANCSWRANWVAPVGGVTVANYILTDTQGGQQTVTATQAYVNCPINNQFGKMPSSVRACGSAGTCSISVNFP